MTGLRELLLQFRALIRKNRFEDEMDEEMRFHLEKQVEDNIQAGMDPEDARYAALRSFGGVDQIKEECRQMNSVNWLENVNRDLRYAVRMLLKSPGFTVVALLTLALGIGANTAIFTVVNAVLLRRLPVERPQELLELRRGLRGQQTPPGGGFSYPVYKLFRDQNEVFTGIVTASLVQVRAKVSAEAEPVEGQYVSGNFYSVLGVRAAIGRTLAEEDDRIEDGGSPPVVVISYGFWQRAFGQDPSVIGRQLSVEGKQFTIVGVSAAGFSGIQTGRPQEFAIPIVLEPRLRPATWLGNVDFNWLAIVGRVKPGMSARAAEANLNVIYKAHLENRAGTIHDSGSRQRFLAQVISVNNAGRGLARLRDQYAKPLYILMAMVGSVLLIACVNIANLLLARASARRREFAVRLALGASRGRLISQLMTEAVLLALAGGALGLVFAGWTSALLVTFLKGVRLDVHPDATVLSFTGAVCLSASLIFGLVPALRATRAQARLGLEGVGGRAVIGSDSRLRALFIVSQVALSLVLVIGAALSVATLRNLETLDPGFRREHVLLANVNPGRAGYKDARLVTFYEQLLRGVRQLPGVRAAGLSMLTPISGAQVDLPAVVEGYSAGPNEDTTALINQVSPGYFETIGTPIVLGRDFNPQDGDPTSPRVVMINETMARYYFSGANPIGRQVKLGREEPAEIIGVVKDAKYNSLRETTARTAYLNCLQDPKRAASLSLAVQTIGPVPAAVNTIRRTVQTLDAAVPISGFTPFARQVEESLLQEQLMATLSSLFGGLALLMASIGLYGVLAYAVERRTREIGIRMALGACGANVILLVLRETLLLVVIGISLGLPTALALGRFVATLLYGLKPGDPGTLATATALLLGVAVVAGYFPVRRAARLDPMAVLRHE